MKFPSVVYVVMNDAGELYRSNKRLFVWYRRSDAQNVLNHIPIWYYERINGEWVKIERQHSFKIVPMQLTDSK